MLKKSLLYQYTYVRYLAALFQGLTIKLGSQSLLGKIPERDPKKKSGSLETDTIFIISDHKLLFRNAKMNSIIVKQGARAAVGVHGIEVKKITSQRPNFLNFYILLQPTCLLYCPLYCLLTSASRLRTLSSVPVFFKAASPTLFFSKLRPSVAF